MDILLILSSKLISDEMKDLFGNIPSSLIPVSNKTLLGLIYEKNKEKYDKIIVTGKEKIELIEETIKNKKMNSLYTIGLKEGSVPLISGLYCVEKYNFLQALYFHDNSS